MARMFRVRVDNSDLERALRGLGSYSNAKKLQAEEAIRKSTLAIARSTRARAPIGASGKLRRSVKSSYSRRDNAGTVYSASPYAHLQEFGVKATTAKPKNKKAMRIKKGGDNIFSKKRITIPARPARPFLKPAFEEEKPRLMAELTRILRSVP